MQLQIPDADLFIDSRLDRMAKAAGCYARIKWVTQFQARFTLHPRPMARDYASDQQHDQVIAAIFDEWPMARVRTALATYNGADSFKAREEQDQ